MLRCISKASTARAVCVASLAFVLASLSGCGTKARAVVRGNVTFGGAPVKTGEVSFFTSDNRVGTAQIVNGKYEMKDAPVGDVKITVTTPPLGRSPIRPVPRPKDIAGMPTEMLPPDPEKESGNKSLPVPDKYKDAKTTDLTYTVEKGEHEYDIPLKP